MAFAPFAVASLILLTLIGKNKKSTPPKRTKEQQQSDELITVILPIINKDI